MARRKKKKWNSNFILVILAIGVGAWIAADFWFNIYKHPQKEDSFEPVAVEPAAPDQKTVVVENSAPVLENGFKKEIYRDERYGFEFQYPITAAADARCPKLEKTEDGLSLGIFSGRGAGQGALADYTDRQLEGMEIEKRESLTVAGQNAVQVDYQTAGMGWYGSSVFIEGKTKFLNLACWLARWATNAAVLTIMKTGFISR